MRIIHRAAVSMKMTAAILLGVLASAPATAAPMLDQQNIITTGVILGSVTGSFVSGFRSVQTITAGMTGLLTRVDVQGVGLTGLNIFGTTNGVPNNILLGTGGTPMNDTFGFIGFSTSIFVTAGQVFAIEPTGKAGVSRFSEGMYADGVRFILNPFYGVNTFTPEGDGEVDEGFLTYVDSDVAAVPEPATWSMMVTGFGALGFALRRRRQASTAFLGQYLPQPTA